MVNVGVMLVQVIYDTWKKGILKVISPARNKLGFLKEHLMEEINS